MEETKTYWRKCSTCKKEINFNKAYQVCSVSSCRKNVYCSVDCWDVHVPVMGHKSAWAEEERSPQSSSDERTPRKILVSSKTTTLDKGSVNYPIDVLIVASKLKSYIKAKHDMNTSGNVMDKLSQIVRIICDEATENARAEGRKTLMDRDFK